MANLQLKQIVKSYNNKYNVISPLNLTIKDGEFIVLIGPSGCGKSTILRLIAGLEHVTSGDIYIDNERITNYEPCNRGIAMVFQNYALYPHMNVFENMAYGLKIRGYNKKQIQFLIQQTSTMLELNDFLNYKPHELSGGQKQRVAIGRALVREPKVFLFDEPLSNIDTKLRAQMRLELQKLHNKLNTTSLYVTHDHVEAMTLAERIVVFNQGRIEQIGTPTEIYSAPINIFVANFIGNPAMNLLPGYVTSDGRFLQLYGGPLIILPHIRIDLSGKLVTAGIRSEHIKRLIYNASTSSFDKKVIKSQKYIQTSSTYDNNYSSSHSEIICNLQVTNIERLGADNLVHGYWQKCNIVARLAYDDLPISGTIIYLSSPSHLWHYFDSHSGIRIEV